MFEPWFEPSLSRMLGFRAGRQPNEFNLRTRLRSHGFVVQPSRAWMPQYDPTAKETRWCCDHDMPRVAAMMIWDVWSHCETYPWSDFATGFDELGHRG